MSRHPEVRAKRALRVSAPGDGHRNELHMNSIDIRITRPPHGDDLPLPSYQSALAAGMDLLAAVPADAPLTLAPGVRALVPTGIAIALPGGTEAQVRRAPASPSSMASPCSTRRAPSTPITAARCRCC